MQRKVLKITDHLCMSKYNILKMEFLEMLTRKLIFITKTEGSNPTPPPPPPPPTCEEKYPAPAGYSVEDTDFGT